MNGLKWVERFHIYVLSVGNLAAGASLIDIPLPLDNDAPFELRGRGGRCQNDPRYFQAGMNSLLVQYRDANGVHASDAPVPWYLDVPLGGLGGNWKPVSRGKFYPIRSSLETSIYNTGPNAVDLTNVQLYYVGVKKYPPGRPWAAFPQHCYTLPFDYTWWSKSLGTFIPTQDTLMPPDTGGAWLNQSILIQNDADFALMAGQCGIFGGTSEAPRPNFYMELFCSLRDADTKQAYSSAPVHVDWLFGSPHQSVVSAAAVSAYFLPNGTQSVIQSSSPLYQGLVPGQTPLVGPWHPGLFYPQIYLRANQRFLFDLIRTDGGYTTSYNTDGSTSAVTPPDINFMVQFRGLKVFHK